MPLRSAVKQSLGTLTAALFVLAIAAIAAWTVGTRPRPETMLEADLAALQDLGVPTSLTDVKQASPENSAAAEHYERVGADFNALVAARGPRWYESILSEQPSEQVLTNALAIFESHERLFNSLMLAVKEREFVPKQKPILWESTFTGENRVDFLKSYGALPQYLHTRMRVYAAATRKERALESIPLAFRIAEQMSAYPGSVSNQNARTIQGTAYAMADELSKKFPANQRLQLRLLALVELSKPVDLRPAYLLQPALAFSLLDSGDQLPSSLIPPDLVTSGVPAVPPMKTNAELANSAKVRGEIKALLAAHFRTFFEDFPDDESDSQTLAKLIQDESLDQSTLAARIAKVLASNPISPSAANLTGKKRQQVIDSIRSRLNK